MHSQHHRVYLPQVINSGLQDQSPYVRKTAVIGVIKLAMVAPECAAELVDTLYKMIRDRDPQVVATPNPYPRWWRTPSVHWTRSSGRKEV